MKKHIIPISIIALTILIWIITYSKLPSELPVHWNFNGEVDGYSSKLNAMLTQVAIMVLIYVSIAFLPKIDPRKKNYKYFSSSYQLIYNALLGIFFALNVLMILYGLGYDIPMSALGTVIIGVIFIVLGNVMQRIRSNFFLGLRTPWTLSNDEVWKKTHRFGGKLFFGCGIILLLSTFLSGVLKQTIIIAVLAVVIVAPYLYSYWQFKKLS
ncbi:SdpI family protein [Bacillus sp. T3]|uniref:SdpI family protein n=1 Tax=Bacillus sp. T3 TaxID=467262 RepID=UPI002981F9DB|nr:SdpI family protein [Bacillus sp. T3]